MVIRRVFLRVVELVLGVYETEQGSTVSAFCCTLYQDGAMLK
jgi:hypothetical protein